MASPSDYRKPRNKELQDLAWNLPTPIRVKDAKGQIIWQNIAAEELSQELNWIERATTWQGKKAVLETPLSENGAEAIGHLNALEGDVERLKKQQRQTARKKRQAETRAKQQENAFEVLEKQVARLREKVSELESENSRLQGAAQPVDDTGTSIEALRDRIAELERELSELVETQSREREKDHAELQKKELTLAEREAALQSRVEELLEREAEFQRKSEASEEARQASQELEQWRAEREALLEEKTSLENWVEDLEQKDAEQVRRFTKLQTDYDSLRKEFDEFQKKMADEDAERQLEAQLAAKVAEFEQLERTLEEEQRSFEDEKRALQEKLKSQEEEFVQLKSGFESRSREQKAVTEQAAEPTAKELESLKEALQASERRERRLAEKAQTLEELRIEHAQVLEMLKEDLKASRAAEKELRERFREQANSATSTQSVLESLKAAKNRLADLEASEFRLRQELTRAQEEAAKARVAAAQPATNPGLSESDLSTPVKNHLDLLKSRLTETEKKLDQTRAELKAEQAKTQGNKESERLAFQDSLTGLPNRHMVDRYLAYAHHQSSTTGRSIGLFLIDIDGFRVLNGTFGREFGDSLLKAVGERLNSMRGASHLVARHSQDRFVLLAADIERPASRGFAEQASKSLLEALAYPFEVKGTSVHLTGSIGASLGPLGDDSRELYLLAETALGAAKRQGTGRYHLFDETLKQSLAQETLYTKQMHHAVEKDEFRALYQPIYNLQKGKVLGLELLLRWERRDQTTLKPAEFLEAAIKSGVLFQITERLWPKAFRYLAFWQKKRPGLTLSINLCDRELLTPGMARQALGWAQEVGLDPSSILFEVRDSSAIRLSSRWWPILQEFSQAGFGLTLDDYGSDSSLFGTLAYHGFRQAKVMVDERSPAFVPSLQAQPSVQYCAKGLQTRFDKKALAKAGFSLAQGYAVSRPIGSDEVEGLLS